MNRYGTDQAVLVPTVMLERLADDLVEARRLTAACLAGQADKRVVKVVTELRMLADTDLRRIDEA